MKNNYYNILELPLDATPEEIRAAYYEKIKQYHPDANSSSDAKELFFLHQKAYEELTDSCKRLEYDRSLDLRESVSINFREIYSAPSIQLIDEEQLLYYMIEVTQNKIGKDSRDVPISIVLLLDRSTSMSGERLVIVKNGILRLLKYLREDDMIGVIAFSDKAEIIIPMMTVAKARFQEQKILAIQAFGATEMYKGLSSAESLLSSRDMKDFSKKIILLTDGHTYGDEEQCIQLAEVLGQQSIGLYAVGFGNEWNDGFLDKITAISGGVAEFAETSEQLIGFFHDKIIKNSSIFADTIQMELESSDLAKITYCFRIAPDASPIQMNPIIRLGSLNENSKMILIFELKISSMKKELKKCKLLSGKIIFNVPGSDVQRKRIIFNAEIPVSLQHVNHQPVNSIINAISKLTLYRMQEKARQEVRANLPKKASQRLNQLASQLLDQGEKELAINIIHESHNIQRSGYFTKEGEKRIKYGTRRLLLNSGIESES